MLRCIVAEYPSNLPFVKESLVLHERKRLLLRLLSDREIVRVICAPSGYGKSVLAYQYATRVFSDREVAWVNAEDLSFLLALDQPLSDRFIDRYLGNTKSKVLFVFDACPSLPESRFVALLELVKKLLDVGHEVVITTADVRWAETAGVSTLVVDACELLLDDVEQAEDGWRVLPRSNEDSNDVIVASMARDRKGYQDHVSNEEGFALSRIVGFRNLEARESFFRLAMNSKIENEMQALACVALLMGSGALHELVSFTQGLGNTTLAAYLERHYPHCGTRRLDPMFHAVALSSDQKFVLVRNHLPSLLAKLSAFDEEDRLVDTLVGSFFQHGEELLAMQLVAGLNDDDRKWHYFDRYASSLLLELQPLALLKLAAALSSQSYTKLERWESVMVGLSLMGDTHQIERLLVALRKRFHEKASALNDSLSEVQTTLFCELVRFLFELSTDRDPGILLPYVRAYAEEVKAKLVFAPSCRSYEQDLLALIERVLIDPDRAVEELERICTTGYTVKEELRATAVFIQLMLHFWEGLIVDKKEDDRTHLNKGQVHKTDQLRLRIEKHLMQLLERQKAILPPNRYELFLFKKAKALFGERLYLIMNDELLMRVEASRRKLVDQQERWRKEHSIANRFKSHASRRTSARSKKPLRINTLGRFEIESQDPSIVIQSRVRKQLRLLISLLVINEGREVSRPWIQRVMWPDAPERNARQNLYSMWSLLNKSITDASGACPFFESFPRSVTINGQLVETDVHLLIELCKRLRSQKLEPREYEAILEELQDVYRGPLLPGHETAEVVAYRKRYQDHLLEALMITGSRLRKQGKTALALRYFRFAFANEPTREDVCYQLMMTLWKLGRHGEALNEYFVCHRALVDELGLEGSSRLRELYEAILRDAS